MKNPTGQIRQNSRMGTSVGQSDRPMTSNKAAGYSKTLGKSQKGPARNIFFATKKEAMTKEQIIREMEKGIQKLFDESILLKCRGDFHSAKDKALSAIEKFNDFKKNNSDYFNTELEFGLKLNLGLVYQAMNNLDEALSMYQEIVMQENYHVQGMQVARIRVNIGNIHYANEDYKSAIKEYRKALDKISKENKDLRANISKNIGQAKIKMGMYRDAVNDYVSAIQSSPDVRTAMNLLLCHLANRDKKSTMEVFNIMLDFLAFGEKEGDSGDGESKQMDSLSEYLIMKKKENANIITNIALMLTYYLEDKDPMNAFDSILDALKKNGIKDILNEIEMAKAMYFLKKRDIEKTIKIMKSFENKDKRLIARVSNNISFLYFTEGDLIQAETYANIALENERYNNKALVNKGNIYFQKEDFMKAKEFYLEAIGVQSDCVEAIYNLGMVNERIEANYEALQAFDKLNSVTPGIPEVLYKIARLNEKIKDYDSALKFYSLLLSQIPNDPILLSSIGNLYYNINVSAIT